MNVATLVTVFLIASAPLVPTEPMLVGLGVLAATSHTVPIWIILVAALGCTVSDHLLYLIGRYAGSWALGRLIRKRAGTTAEAWLNRNVGRWGASVVITGRWVPGGGTVSTLLAGTLCWRMRRFTPAAIVGSTLWASYATLLGYFGGSIIHDPVLGVILSVGIAMIIATTMGLLARRNNGDTGESTVEPSELDDLVASGRIIAPTSRGPIPLPQGDVDYSVDSTDVIAELRE